MTKIAFTTYEKVLVEVRSALRGDEFYKNEFIGKMKIMDEMIIDQTPLADRFSKGITRNLFVNYYYYLKKHLNIY